LAHYRTSFRAPASDGRVAQEAAARRRLITRGKIAKRRSANRR
jgi:hypothetical protein